jgi:hypothetical protein
MINSVAQQTVYRLADKVAQVRKRAVLLLTAILEYNPYQPALPLSQIEKIMQDMQQKVLVCQCSAVLWCCILTCRGTCVC